MERRDTQTHTQTHTQTLELSCAMQNKKLGEPLSLISPISWVSWVHEWWFQESHETHETGETDESGAEITIWNHMEVNSYSKQAYVRAKQLI